MSRGQGLGAGRSPPEGAGVGYSLRRVYGVAARGDDLKMSRNLDPSFRESS
jgi:hypothetical protein